MDWIDVNEKIPQKNQIVLVYSPIDGIGLAALDTPIMSKNWYWLYKKVNGSKLVQTVTHWAEVNPPNNGLHRMA